MASGRNIGSYQAPLIVLSGLAAIILGGCLLNDQGPIGKVWMSIAPIQCLGNPWEQDWLANHDDNYDAYPRDLSKPGLEEEEKEIIQSYYQQRGVTIEAFATTEWDGAVCLACSCPQGYTMYTLVAERHEQTMLDFGYVRSDSPN